MELIYDLTSGRIRLSAEGSVQRERVTPEHLRSTNYDDQYDFHTFCYDAFEIDGHAVMVCPPLLNFEKLARLNHDDLANLQINRRKKVDVISVKDLSAEDMFTVDVADQSFYPTLGRNRRNAFAGRKAILTMFKFEPLAWLQEWVEFNVRYHGADAALIYCNDLPHAKPQQVLEALESVDGLKTIGVVDFPFPYGPGNGAWEAHFCQFGMLEHARLKYLADAEAVLVGDIDELVITSDHRSAFAILGECPDGFAMFGGKFVSTATASDPSKPILERRHRDYCFVSPRSVGTPEYVGTKWMISPKKTGAAQWLTHRVVGFPARSLRSEIELRHYLNMSTGWNENRPPSIHAPEFDPELVAAYQRVGWDRTGVGKE